MLRNARSRVISRVARRTTCCVKMLTTKKPRQYSRDKREGAHLHGRRGQRTAGYPSPDSVPLLEGILDTSPAQIGQDLHPRGVLRPHQRGARPPQGRARDRVGKEVLREGNTDTGEIKERIERLSESLEKLKGNGSAADEALSSQAMRTMLARQSLIMSAMFNLTEMVEELLLASGEAAQDRLRGGRRRAREVAPRPDRAPRTRGPCRPALRPGHSPGLLNPRHARREVRLSGAAETPNLVGAPGGCWSAVLALPKLVGEPFAGLPPRRPGARARPTPRTRGRRTKRRRIRRRGTWRRRGLLQRTARPGCRHGYRGPGPDSEGAAGRDPDVSGRDVVEAARKLGAGYDVATIQTVKSEVEAGTTLRTKPAGNGGGVGNPGVLVTSGGPSGQAADWKYLRSHNKNELDRRVLRRQAFRKP